MKAYFFACFMLMPLILSAACAFEKIYVDPSDLLICQGCTYYIRPDGSKHQVRAVMNDCYGKYVLLFDKIEKIPFEKMYVDPVYIINRPGGPFYAPPDGKKYRVRALLEDSGGPYILIFDD